MATNFIKHGERITVTATQAIASGAGVLTGLLFGVAQTAAAIGEEVEIHTCGVYDLPKTSAQAWAQGVAIYWNAAAGLASTASPAGSVFIGVAATAAANPSSTGRVRLNGTAPAAVET
ncbi:MAG: capsid cement protein [Pseudomonadota bacterium]